MKKFFFLICFLGVSIKGFAYATIIDGIYYNIINSEETGKFAEVTYGHWVYIIGSEASFEINSYYKGEIVIPETIEYGGEQYEVKKISNYAFAGCSQMQSIKIPSTVDEIGKYAFSLCELLNFIIIPNSVTNIGEGAFSMCSNLCYIYIPSSIYSLEDYTFNSCKKLKDLYCYAEKCPVTTEKTFIDCDISDIKLHVPETSIDQYKVTNPWKDFAEIIPIIDKYPNNIGIIQIAYDRNNNRYYDLKGSYLNIPHKGMNIINGKKIIIR